MIGKEIKEIRMKLGITQEEFASRIGVSKSSVQNWESRRSKPSPVIIKIIKEIQENIKD